MNSSYIAQRTTILQQMAAIESMELGSLKAEYRTSSSGTKSGPYFKHQVWSEGDNLSQRVSRDDAPALEAAIANRQLFESLAKSFIDLTVEHTRKANFSDNLKKKTSRASSPNKRNSPI